MKKTIYYFVLFSTFMLLTALSCKKQIEPEEQLPSGENTMYYYVNGELYIPRDKNIGGMYAPAIGYSICDVNSSTFSLRTINLMLFFYEGIHETGSITLNQSHYDTCQVHDNHAYYGQKELGSDGVYHNIDYFTHDGSGTVNITYLSEDKRKFKGTFEMTVYHEDTDAEIHITDGHFNINLDTLNN